MVMLEIFFSFISPVETFFLNLYIFNVSYYFLKVKLFSEYLPIQCITFFPQSEMLSPNLILLLYIHCSLSKRFFSVTSFSCLLVQVNYPEKYFTHE